MDDEALYLYLLLMHGPDPEPSQGVANRAYRRWLDEVLDTIKGHGLDVDTVFANYWRWLAKNGLHHKH